MSRLSPPKEVLEIARRLEESGYETWCVGGAVRDALLGHPHLDWDLATAATPEQIRRLFRRTVPLGIEFGTVGVLDRAGVMHEVTTFRRDVQTDGRHAVVEFGASLDEDLARRDFTINAIAYSPRRDQLHDPFGGREDLARRVVRAVGVPEERMREDRLRALRAIRFASRFDFQIDPATWDAVVASAPHLGRLSPERVKQELEKTMEQVAHPALAIMGWRESGALATLVPALADLPVEHILALDCVPVPGRATRTERASARRLLRLALLFAALDGPRAEATLRALRFSNTDVRWIGALAERWHALMPVMTAALSDDGLVSEADVRRWVAQAGRPRIGPLLRGASALWEGRRRLGMAAPDAPTVRSLYRRALRSAYRDPVELRDLAIDGSDLQDARIPGGPVIGKILQALLDWVLEEPARNTRDSLLAEARRLYDEMRDTPEAR